MKRIITAIGSEELNNVLREQDEIIVESTDIQYQEGIIEALDTYPNIDLVILNEEIIGELSLEDLILSITIIKNDIQIILISNDNTKIDKNKNIIKIVNNNKDYVEEIIKYLFNKVYLNKKSEVTNSMEIDDRKNQKTINELRLTEKIKFERKRKIADIIKDVNYKFKEVFKKPERMKKMVVCIGNSGVRKNNIFSYIIKNFEWKKDSNYRF